MAFSPASTLDRTPLAVIKFRMKRAVITGYGIVSSIGNNVSEVTASLKAGRSGIIHDPDFAERGFRSHVRGKLDIDLKENVPRKALRFMGDSSAYAFIAMQEAIDMSGLSEDQVRSDRTGVVAGIGGSSTKDLSESYFTFQEKGYRRVGPYYVPRTMASGPAANLATAYKVRGVSYSISSACASSANCIGHASELIQLGKADVVFAGGGEEIFWTGTMLFDAMGALCGKFNDQPERASRPYDANRAGFVASGGGGVVVVESLEHAQARGAAIHAELTGYASTSDGADMVAPSGEGASRCMSLALASAGNPTIDYVNTHGTSTPVGDITELNAMRDAFGADSVPPYASTKSMTGHALGAAGVHEAIYALEMMRHKFIAPSINVDEPDPGVAGTPLVTERRDNTELSHCMSNSFGFGGTNASLIFSKFDG